ncbi:aminotransferase class III-fold pyridoxal phosphate-dependent enzyme [Kineococcus aurantiacus]|uniref:Glutamate-1-semialdehyde 2,1-aminomutase n=1 Tax=Kineococcus aurantiacus TaxID=37633 RepID=A0A7Y9J332_9ACTN|nr:glutamate-1-semialdehyde 2,1-aminomutase [Kineococcus aurantiacus]
MTTIDTGRTLVADGALRARAEAVVPGGVYGHLRVTADRGMPPSYPQFFARGSGARLWDVDGNEYVDLMCAFGPMVAGYANPVVDAAARAQLALGDALTGPGEKYVEYAERLVGTVAHADWAMFAKNGTDATSMSVVIARAATGRTKLLKAEKAYHGANPWFTPSTAGVVGSDRADIVEFDYDDLASLERAAASVEGDVAAIVVTPFRHDGFVDQHFPSAEFARGVRALADRTGAALILDEVRTTFRVDLAGAWERFGVRPDLTAMSKALANGHALSAVVGVDSLREAAASIFVTGSFWMAGVPFAAAIATLDWMVQTDGLTRMLDAGQVLRDGLQAQASAHGLGVVQTGPTSMPFLRFEDEPRLETAIAFTDAAARRGVLVHPWHNMFVSAAHTPEDIATVLERTDEAFAEVARSR